MNNVARYDKGEVRGDAIITSEGYIRANAVVTRTGIFKYQNSDGSIRKELRHPDDIWNAESVSSMELIPVTNGHPTERMVTADNSKRLAVGFTGENIKRDGDFVMTNFVVTDHEAVNAIKNHNRKELSLGYLVDLEEEPGEYKGESYDARQRNVRYNHLALVDKARAGSEARIALDSADAFEILTEVPEMAKRKIKIDNEEVMVEESTADYVDRLHEDLKNLSDEKARVESEMKMIQEKLEKTEVERDSMKDQMNTKSEPDREAQAASNMDSDDFKNAVNERLRVYKSADAHLSKDKIANLDSMSNVDIKKAIISVCRSSINLDGKSNVYIDAMFDTIEDEKMKNVNCDNVKFDGKKQEQNNDSATSPVEKARLDMIERNKNQYKGAK